VNHIHNDVGTQFPTDDAGALERLFELAVLLTEAMDRGLGERGLTRARAEVIWRLHHQGPATQRALSQALQCTPRNVTGLLDALEADGFVARGPHPTDRRATLVTLTERGRTAAATWQGAYQQLATTLFSDIAVADRTAFVTILDHLLGRLRDGASATSSGLS
jgi:DNA-binding MarR family transcriptional regulator